MKCNNLCDNQNLFKGGSLYNATAYVQDHTLINRGITTLGGSTIHQCIMSNNKYEAQERALMGGIYFVASYLTPIMLIPVYNRHFLKNKGVIKEFGKIAERIIQVPKEYLTPEGDLLKGLKKTAENFDKKEKNNDTSNAFKEIYNRYDNPNKLKKDLLSVHEKVLMTDFITTGVFWSAIPWIATELTEHRTKRTDFSAGFNLKTNEQSEKEKSKNNKKKKLLWNIAFCTIPGIIYSKIVTKGLSAGVSDKGFITKFIAKNADKFNYVSGTNMSKLIYASIWILSSFPAKIISARDSNERKDRALRDAGLFAMFFGGDFLINNILGRCADKFLGTKIMKDSEKNLNFLQRFSLGIKNFRLLEEDKSLSKDVLAKTKKAGAGIYWASLLTNTALIGFVLPKILNKFLRHNIEKEQKKSAGV